jgi:hypothetical protein
MGVSAVERGASAAGRGAPQGTYPRRVGRATAETTDGRALATRAASAPCQIHALVKPRKQPAWLQMSQRLWPTRLGGDMDLASAHALYSAAATFMAPAFAAAALGRLAMSIRKTFAPVMKKRKASNLSLVGG